jgi:hypothetical protein
MSFAEAHSFVLADPTCNELTFGLLAVVKNFDSQQYFHLYQQTFSSYAPWLLSRNR